MRKYLDERQHAEDLISNDHADLGKRIEAAIILLQHPLPAGLRVDLRRLFLEWTDELSEGRI